MKDIVETHLTGSEFSDASEPHVLEGAFDLGRTITQGAWVFVEVVSHIDQDASVMPEIENEVFEQIALVGDVAALPAAEF